MADDEVRVREQGPAGRSPALALVHGLARALGALSRPLAVAAAGGWMLLIWWLSSGPIDVHPPIPEMDFFWNLAHAPVFGVLAALTAVAVTPRPLPGSWPDPGRRARLVAFLLVAAWAATDELHQGRVPGRSSSPFDFATDVVGAACVLWIAGYAGSPGADERGLRRRFAIGIALCAAAALASTAVDRESAPAAQASLPKRVSRSGVQVVSRNQEYHSPRPRRWASRCSGCSRQARTASSEANSTIVTRSPSSAS